MNRDYKYTQPILHLHNNRFNAPTHIPRSTTLARAGWQVAIVNAGVRYLPGSHSHGENINRILPLSGVFCIFSRSSKAFTNHHHTTGHRYKHPIILPYPIIKPYPIMLSIAPHHSTMPHHSRDDVAFSHYPPSSRSLSLSLSLSLCVL